MIVVRIIGGLGNQMFQYALGRRLSLERDTPLLLDTSGFESYTLHALSLDHLSIAGTRASAEQIAALTSVPPKFPENVIPRRWLPRAFRRSRRLHPRHVVEKQGFHFDPAILDQTPPVYLDGYWQSERYFNSIAEQLRQDFQVRSPLAGRDEEIATQIEACTAISLHVRRGDYAQDEATRARHGLCPISYYEAAAAYMADKLESSRFFVFSDDPSWAAANLPLPEDSVFVDHNDAATNYEDLRLMSLCRHHVIANSSFSWWGAWLNPRADKTVIAPKAWVADPAESAPDVCPQSWVRL